MAGSKIWRCVLLLLAALVVCQAASPTSFCKCTCFSNSTIIALDDASKSTAGEDDKVVKKRSCQDCSKQFCLDYNLPICKAAKEEDVLTQCFQRDSTKDELVVFIFIFVTVGLLAWATAKPWIEQWQNKQQAQQAYVPVSINEEVER